MKTYSAVSTTTYCDGTMASHTMYFKERSLKDAKDYAELVEEWRRGDLGIKHIQYTCVCEYDPKLV